MRGKTELITAFAESYDISTPLGLIEVNSEEVARVIAKQRVHTGSMAAG